MKLVAWVFVGSVASIAAAIWALLRGIDKSLAHFKI